MRTTASFVSGLLMSAVLLLSTPAHTAELEPFFMVKTASANTLISVAEKISSMAGVNNDPNLQTFINVVKGVKGFDLDGIAGVAATANDGSGINVILVLPVTDLWGADVPAFPGFFDQMRPFLVKRGEDRTDINLPMGTYVALQKQGYLVVVPEDLADQVPADARKLFAGLEKFTLGVKLDLEKVKFETLEATIFGPMLMMAAMADPAAGEQIENAIEIYRELYKEFASISYGIIFNSQTADVEILGDGVARQGSELAKAFASYKQQPTIFGGFRGTPENTVFAVGDSGMAMQVNFGSKKLQELSLKQWEAMLAGLLEQIEMDDESGETADWANKVIESLSKIMEAESKRGSSDYACSINIDGTLMFAADTVSLEEFKKLAALITDFACQRISPIAAAFDIDVQALVNKNYATVEGFRVSSFKVPMERVVSFVPGPDDLEVLKGLTPGVFWAVKEGDKQAAAFALGWDFAKTEQTFTSALEKTKTPVPVQKPVLVFSLQGLGKFLQQMVYPIAEATVPMPDELAVVKKILDILATSGNDATITLDVNVNADRMEGGYRISGKAIQAIISAAKVVIEVSETSSFPGVRDF